MLVLSRKRGEGIVIGEGVTVTVLDVRGGRVRLGFDGPAEVPIHREEVHQRIEDCTAVLQCTPCV
jgi:carbon storage regulator